MAKSPAPRPGSSSGASSSSGSSTPGPRGVSQRDRLREQQEAEMLRRRRNRALIISVLSLLVVIALVVAFAVHGHHKRTKDNQKAASASAGLVLVQALHDIPASSFDAVGAGSVDAAPQAVPNGQVEKVDGKPRVLYVGAGFCPYCAMTRLSLVAALDRFGSFSNLTQAVSTANDSVRNIPTVSFHGATYASDHLAFNGYEVTDRDNQPLDTLPAADAAIEKKLDPDGNIPFVYWGLWQSSTPFDGSMMQDMTPDAVASALKDSSSAEAQGIIGGANLMSAQVCRLTGGQPSAVCDSAGVKAAAATWLK